MPQPARGSIAHAQNHGARGHQTVSDMTDGQALGRAPTKLSNTFRSYLASLGVVEGIFKSPGSPQ